MCGRSRCQQARRSRSSSQCGIRRNRAVDLLSTPWILPARSVIRSTLFAHQMGALGDSVLWFPQRCGARSTNVTPPLSLDNTQYVRSLSNSVIERALLRPTVLPFPPFPFTFQPIFLHDIHQLVCLYMALVISKLLSGHFLVFVRFHLRSICCHGCCVRWRQLPRLPRLTTPN